MTEIRCYLRRYGDCSHDTVTIATRSRSGGMDLIRVCSKHVPMLAPPDPPRPRVTHKGMLSREDAEQLLAVLEVTSS